MTTVSVENRAVIADGARSTSRFRDLFVPRAVALVGATDRSMWSQQVHANLSTLSADVTVHCVNPKGGVVHGQEAVTSLADIDGPVDLAYIMSPRETVPDVVRQAGAAGVRVAIVLTAGFSELADGAELDRELAEAARTSGVTLLGPNVSGFLNIADNVFPFGLALPDVPAAGPASYVMQSGGLVKPMLALATAWGCGVGTVACTGNESLTTVVDVIDTMLDDPRVGAIGIFLETVRDPEGLQRVADRARLADVPLVALTVGHSEVSQRTAQAHTGALAGDTAVRSAALRAMGVIEVASMEELVATTDLLARGVRPGGDTVAVIGASGGACGVIADTAAREGIRVPQLGAECAEALSRVLPGISSPQNPLDVTGVATTDKALPVRALETVLAHESGRIDAVLFEAFVLPAAGDVPAPVAEFYRLLGAAAAAAVVPVLLLDEVSSTVSPAARSLLEQCGLTRLPGTALGVQAFAHAVAWTRGRQGGRSVPERPGGEPLRLPPVDGTTPLSEHEALELLAAGEVPVVPRHLARSADEAVQFAEHLGVPVAMKVCSAQVQHKSDVGGVLLDLRGPADVRQAFESIVGSVSVRQPDATIDGVLVAPMRTGSAVELIVGVQRDPSWGPVLMVGIGGVLVEVLRDVSLQPLPVTRADVEEMLSRLRGAPLLDEVRGRAAVDRAALVDAVLAVAGVAEALGDRLESLEINPLRADHRGVEALDALVVWTQAMPEPKDVGGRQ